MLFSWASLVAQTVKRLPVMRETQVRSLGWEDPLEKEMTTHSSILAWRIPCMEKPGRLQSMGSQRVGHDSRDLVCTQVIYQSQLYQNHLDLELGSSQRDIRKLLSEME